MIASAMQHIDTALLIFCLASIVGLYVWCFRQISELKTMQADHENKHDIHIKADDLVYRDVCDIHVKHFGEQLTEVKESMEKGFDKIESLIKDRHQ